MDITKDDNGSLNSFRNVTKILTLGHYNFKPDMMEDLNLAPLDNGRLFEYDEGDKSILSFIEKQDYDGMSVYVNDWLKSLSVPQ
jgi:hypothetical protein